MNPKIASLLLISDAKEKGTYKEAEWLNPKLISAAGLQVMQGDSELRWWLSLEVSDEFFENSK